jgi:transketolase
MDSIDFSPANVKRWSRIGSRATFGLVALELGRTIDDLMILTADVSTSAGLDRFKKQYPEKYLDVGIAEQNLIGIAAGLSSEGMTVFSTTFAPFQTMRCCEQIKVNLGYMNQKVCMVGLASGLVLGTLGYTHCCIEDLSIMRSIPGITVLSPADCGETVKAVQAAVGHYESVYIRLTGGANNPIVYSENYKYVIGKSIKLVDGEDISIIATGPMVHVALDVAVLLQAANISTAVYNMHTIKPIDVSTIDIVSKTSKLVVTVEEHSVIGGLGSAVAEQLTSIGNSPPQLILGIPDRYGHGGCYDDLKRDFGLTNDQIAEKIISSYKLTI